MALPRLPLLAALGVIVVAAFARADDERIGVRDGADLFSPAARQTAEKEIRVFRQELEKSHPGLRPPDVLIETVAAPPEDLRTKAATMKAAQAAPYFHAWAERQAEAAGVEGVYVWISADPGDVEVVVRPDAGQAAFTAFDAKRLHNLLKTMKAGPRFVGQRDKKLLAAVARIGDDFRYNLRPPFPWLPVGGVLAAAFGLWGVLGLVRGRLRAADPVADSSELGRAALFAALLGGMFGTVAGHWIYDTLFVAASRSAPPVAEAAPTPLEASPTENGDAELPPTAAERLDLAARDGAPEESNSPASAAS